MTCCETVGEVTLPVGSDEHIDVPLLDWAPTVGDPTLLTWRSLVTATYDRWPDGAAPPLSDPGWTGSSCVNRGTVSSPRYAIQVRVNVPTADRYGIWVRVAGSAGTSPMRFAGVVRAR